MTPEEYAEFAARLAKALYSKTSNSLPNGVPMFSGPAALELTGIVLREVAAQKGGVLR